MATSVANGTQTAVIGTEHILNTSVPANGTQIGKVSVRDLANGDAFTVRGYDQLDGTTYDLELSESAANVQGTVVFSLPIVSTQNVRFTLEQIAGTARDFDWRVIDL